MKAYLVPQFNTHRVFSTSHVSHRSLRFRRRAISSSIIPFRPFRIRRSRSGQSGRNQSATVPCSSAAWHLLQHHPAPAIPHQAQPFRAFRPRRSRSGHSVHHQSATVTFVFTKGSGITKGAAVIGCSFSIYQNGVCVRRILPVRKFTASLMPSKASSCFAFQLAAAGGFVMLIQSESTLHTMYS